MKQKVGHTLRVVLAVMMTLGCLILLTTERTSAECMREKSMAHMTSASGSSSNGIYMASAAVCSKHAAYQWVTIKSATCTSAGTAAFTCPICKYAYPNRPIKPIDKVDHNYTWKTTVDPTCTQDGSKVYSCTMCGAVKNRKPIASLGHNPGAAATCTKAQTCTRCSAVIQKAGHNPGAAATCTTAQKCTRCSTVLNNALGHNPGTAATCTTAQKCTRCSTVLNNALGHNPGAAATCTTVQKCTRCSTVLNNALGHNPGAAATCTTAQKCTRCSTVLNNALGHNPGAAATCTTSQTCTRCSDVIQKALGHDSEYSVTKQATCTTQGTFQYKCKRCSYTTGGYFSAPDDHTYNVSNATCTVTKYCTNCGHVAQEALGHNTKYSVTKQATCTTQGEYVYECSRCPYTTGGYISSYGHDPGPAATCTTPQKCNRCPDVLQDKLGHDLGPAATCTTPQKCMRCGTVLCEELGHDPGAEPTCTTVQKCRRCPAILHDTLEHSYSWMETRPATCLSEGVESYQCSCGKVKETRAIPKKEHEPDTHWTTTVKPTCGSAGVEVCNCRVCGGFITARSFSGYIEHTWDRSAADCTNDQVCVVCGVTGEKAHGHAWNGGDVAIPQTCTKEGLRVR